MQQLMTREEFRDWLREKRVSIRVWPHDLVACECGDLNCHGWRLVPTRTAEPEAWELARARLDAL